MRHSLRDLNPLKWLWKQMKPKHLVCSLTTSFEIGPMIYIPQLIYNYLYTINHKLPDRSGETEALDVDADELDQATCHNRLVKPVPSSFLQQDDNPYPRLLLGSSLHSYRGSCTSRMTRIRCFRMKMKATPAPIRSRTQQ